MSHKHSQVSLEGKVHENRVEEDFWSENYPKLQRYCQFLARNRWDGDDIAQETFVKALRYGNQQKLTSALLNKIAYNHWVDLLRKRKHEAVEADPDFAHQTLTNQLDETRDSVELLLKNFTPNQAIIFLLKEGFRYQMKEIATILDSTETSVKSNLHRAKKRLEKANEEKQFDSVDSYWDEEERELLSEIFYEALKNQDPAILIQFISSRTRKSNVPKLVTGKFSSKPNYTPSSTLCMAA
ncbi:sigma-70 family RNA polymerase sigma factor [Bacillus sp. ISL-40]|uniref:sigma-70 family RNA polymerase sigma factor n=1 Tax=unclassified Bacillus (in: firmicutes) TaxID=185979 RepID=UPI001BEC4293|nr:MULTISPECIES: sigma-70 family RNA polymerase sigma factor [unclassified Bacillus (in: firmicutes)]MBT2696207.1 sigma-70 family RNA polymerase sigma factor [Bacillus sp. ISL-40]MBT2720362.1 sigma-70 family RNA polymerase sigma factor [Bacillus sp. ISL-46]MBT2743055.1 sigma-70 family RNA polymerase sigma factor [Bacillus sp. ISL-77]